MTVTSGGASWRFVCKSWC